MRRPLRVLIVEDCEQDAELLLEELRHQGFDVVHALVDTAEAMLAALRAQTWDIVVSDYSMPAFDGLQALTVLKASRIDVPLILMSGTIGEESAVEALKLGAADFVVKGRMTRLVPAIEREVREAASRRRRRVTETALAETRERMRFALDAARLGTWEIDFASGRTIWSDVMEQHHGLPAGHFEDTLEAFAASIHRDDRARVLEALGRSFGERPDSRLEYRTTWPDGTTHWVALSGRTFSSESGVPIRAAGVGVDITAQKSLEEQFRQAQKMEAIGGLAAGIAHDFNNLLTVLSGYCELLMARLQNDPDATRELKEVQSATASAVALTRQLLAFSRRQLLAPQVLNLNHVLADKQRMLRRLVEENVQIELRLAEQLGSVNVDAGQMEQVLLNLVINARDAMPHGGRVTIATRSAVIADESAVPPSVPPGAYVVFSVSDTGTGMSPEVQARLFEPFFTTKERGRGTGLGLATVYGIVKQSEGYLAVHSELGRGTTFEIYLPVTAAPVLAPAGEAARPSDSAVCNETILVVEDDAAVRKLSEGVLRRRGYTVLVASDGDRAMQLCTEHRDVIHAALIDVIMPGRSGWDVGEWIAQRRPNTRIVYTSGYTDSAVPPQHRLKRGAVFLQKPFTPIALASKIREALS